MNYSHLQSQISVEIQIYIFRSRWLTAIIVTLVGAYLAIGDVQLVETTLQLRGNLWDALFVIFNNQFFVLIPFGGVFVYLMSDLSKETDFGKSMILRLQSRKQWWWGKFLITVCAALIYTSILVGGIALIVFPVLSWSDSWSEAAQRDPLALNLSSWLLQMSPMIAFVLMAFLLFLGCVAVGLVAQTVVVFTGKPLYGFAASAAVIWAAIAVNNFGLTDELPNIFVHTHWVLSYHNNHFPITLSITYWIICIVLLALLGLWGSQKIDFT